jgi:plastocyanin
MSIAIKSLFFCLLLVGGFPLAACGGKSGGPVVLEDANKPKFAPKGNEGTLNGKIALTGEFKPTPLDMAADAACANKNKGAVSEEIAAQGGKLQNVFIFLKEGQMSDGKKLADVSFEVPAAEAKVDQIGCVYVPHVIGVRAGQTVSFYNSDATVHNVNIQPRANDKYNKTQAAGAAPITQVFPKAESAIRVKCNQHGWMSAWVNVLSHPFFAVSGADGSFAISGVPPGKYTLVAWHEKLGEQTREITVGEKGAVTTDFTFDAGKTAALDKGSLTLGTFIVNWSHH